VIGCVLSVVFFADSMCPEHRLWIELLGGMGIVLGITACVALVRGSASAPLLTLASAVAGMGIGMVDTAHDHVRGSIVLAGFLIVGALTAWPLFIEFRSARWARHGARALAPVNGPRMPDVADVASTMTARAGIELTAPGRAGADPAARSDVPAN
jgi:hypothetical protein